MEVMTPLTAGPNTSRGDPGSSRDTRAATLFVHAMPPRNSRCRDRAAVPGGHTQSSPHRAGYRAGPASHLRRTSFPHPVQSAIEPQLSCVSYPVLLLITAPLHTRDLPPGNRVYCMQTRLPDSSCAVSTAKTSLSVSNHLQAPQIFK